MADIILNTAKSRNIKVIDATHQEIEALFYLASKIIHRKDTMIMFKNFEISNNNKKIFNIATDMYADNNITIFYKEDWLTIPVKNINTLQVNRWIDETINNDGEICFLTCDICVKLYKSMGKCETCYKSICEECISNNFLKNHTTKCPYCKSYEFNISISSSGSKDPL